MATTEFASDTPPVVLAPDTPSPPPSPQSNPYLPATQGLDRPGASQRAGLSQRILCLTLSEEQGIWGYEPRLTRSEALQATRRDLRTSGLTWLGTLDRPTCHDGLRSVQWTEIQGKRLIARSHSVA